MRGISRQQLLERLSQDKTKTERDNASKTLGRMIKRGQLREQLVINPDFEANELTGRGLVLVRVDVPGIRKALQDGRREEERGGQGAIFDDIVQRTDHWLRGPLGNEVPRIALLDCSIVHSADFDIMVSVLFHDHREFFSYVRQVIQATEHVSATQTAFIAHSLAQEVFMAPVPEEDGD